MYNIIKRVFLKKKKLSQVTAVFFFNNSFKNTPRPNWDIQMDWENDV